MSDHTLVAAMRAGDDHAWGSFVRRFRPLLEEYARQTRIPAADWQQCVEEVLERAAMRFGLGSGQVPARLDAYLVQSVRNRYVSLCRSRAAEDRRIGASMELAAGGTDRPGDPVVRSLCSSFALRVAESPDQDTAAPTPIERFAAALLRHLSDDERRLLEWLAQCVPHRVIAEWLGVSYDAATKRAWRLCRRLRDDASVTLTTFPPAERAEIERMLRRTSSSITSRSA